jgi:hypothetical protein
MAPLGIYLLVLAAGWAKPGGPKNRLAGARNFRDFFCLPSAEENRTQPADPAQPHRTFNPRILRSRLYD